MKKFKFFFKAFFLIIFPIILTSCSNFTLLHPHGIVSFQESSLLLIAFLTMLCIIIPVIFMTIYFSTKYHIANKNQIYRPNWSESKTIEVIVWLIPILVICFLAFLTSKYSHELDPKKSIPSHYKPVKINVIALDWRWLFIYPDYRIATINEIAIPKNTPIVFYITSYSVMNSFFIPSLGSQIYAMPGMITKLNLISNDQGKYKGISSNYSGKGFSNMKFTVLSISNKKDFINWINKVKSSPNKLNTIKLFNKIAFPNESNIVEYFSDVQNQLFNKIIDQISSKRHKH